MKPSVTTLFSGPRSRSPSRGATLGEYGVLVGLISVVAALATAELGSKVSSIFAGASSDVAAAASPDGTSAGPPVPTEPVVVEKDSFDAGTPLHVASDRTLVFLDTAPYGYTSSNDSALHANSTATSTSGLAWLDLSSDAIKWPGKYRVDLVVGNFNNKPFVTDVTVGLRSNDAFLSPISSSTPVPALGSTEVWTLTYQITQALIDQGLTFGIDVVYNGENRNASFDDLDITFVP